MERAPLKISKESRVRNLGIALLTGGLALTGCGSTETKAESSTTSPPSAATSTPFSSPPDPKSSTELVFDDLHGGSTIIQVYPGVTESAADKQPDGTFNDGDRVPAECKTGGRTIHSDTSAGEVNRTSDKWIRIDGTPGETQYASAVYAENPTALLKQLPAC